MQPLPKCISLNSKGELAHAPCGALRTRDNRLLLPWESSDEGKQSRVKHGREIRLGEELLTAARKSL